MAKSADTPKTAFSSVYDKYRANLTSSGFSVGDYVKITSTEGDDFPKHYTQHLKDLEAGEDNVRVSAITKTTHPFGHKAGAMPGDFNIVIASEVAPGLMTQHITVSAGMIELTDFVYPEKWKTHAKEGEEDGRPHEIKVAGVAGSV